MLHSNLIRALTTGDNDSAIREIKELGDVNFTASFRHGNFPLLLVAIKKANLEVLELLVDKKIKLDSVDSYGKNALHYAQNGNALENAKYLVSKDQSLLTKGDANGNTPFHEAARNNQIKFLEMYLALNLSSAEIDIKNNEGITPLHLAVIEGSYEACQMLLAAGANPEIKDNFNASARSTASTEVFSKISKLLHPISSLFELCTAQIESEDIMRLPITVRENANLYLRIHSERKKQKEEKNLQEKITALKISP